MKKITLTTCLLLFICFGLTAQQEKGITGQNNWLNGWTDFKPNLNDYGEPTQILTGEIKENITLTKDNVYLLLGDVVAKDSTIITIEPGTVILGDFKTKGSLIVTKGAKLIAEGKPTDPIIFSSSRSVKKAGDWGGVFLLGEAPTNKFGSATSINFGLKPTQFKDIAYGGENIMSNSGILKYVRIEFAGKRTRDYGNFNGLTLAGVGKETLIENIMVSYCLGNSFAVYGGDVMVEKLVSYKANSNDYVFNYGAQVSILNSLALRSPYISSPNGYRSMYVSSYDKIEETDFSKPSTTIYASNITLLNKSNDLENDINIGLVKEGIFVKKDAMLTLSKSVISGYSPAVILDEKIAINNDNLQKITFERCYFNNCRGNIFLKYNSNNDDLESWYGSRLFNNVYSKGPDSETYINSDHPKRPDFRLRIDKIIATTDRDDD